MSNNPLKPLVIFLLALAGLIYVFVTGYAGIQTLKGISILKPDLLVTAATIIGGILSTNLGAVLGVTIGIPQPAGKDNPPSPKFLGLRASFNSSAANTKNKTDNNQKIQIIAGWLYVICLLIAVVFYVIATTKKIPDEKMITLLPEMAKTFIGVLAGAMTVGLGR